MDKLNLKPITDYQLEYCRKRAAKYIFVHDKSGNATCQRCEEDIVIEGTKHKGSAICPHCGANLIVRHDWRAKLKPEIISFMAIPKAIDEHTLVLRFVLAYAGTERNWNWHSETKSYTHDIVKDVTLNAREIARMYIDENYSQPEYYTLCDGVWKKGKGIYFRNDNYMFPNRFDCHYAYEYPRNFFKEINKLDCFKYYPVEEVYEMNNMVTQLHYLIRSARVNEKLAKSGLSNLVNEHHSYYYNHGDRCYRMNNNATDLVSMLKLNREKFNLLKENPTSTNLVFLQDTADLDVNNFRSVECNISKYNSIKDLSAKVCVTFNKMRRYLEGKNIWEYSHYLTTLSSLGYNLHDTYYSMPKDFKKADEIVTAEYTRKQEEERLRCEKIANLKDKQKSIKIKQISEGLKAMSNLQEFLQGSRGLMVYVPESADELRSEGRNLHNCIGTYVDRVAAENTFVFYVRKLSDPTAPFVAFEYSHGKVLQCRYDHNVSVDDDNIISFVDEFANRLRENKFLVA